MNCIRCGIETNDYPWNDSRCSTCRLREFPDANLLKAKLKGKPE